MNIVLFLSLQDGFNPVRVHRVNGGHHRGLNL
nr:MAG TPA: hypothetical protein [Caudoviricetes sp.]